MEKYWYECGWKKKTWVEINDINGVEQIWMELNDYESIWTNMNGFEQANMNGI